MADKCIEKDFTKAEDINGVTTFEWTKKLSV